jgi:4-amino-4-deoxy-L-arabinose transferase-like glycosyltransferase
MEWILGIVLALMLALLWYTAFWTSLAIKRNVQPVVDSFFDALDGFLFVKSHRPKSKSDSRKANSDTT